MIALNKKYFSVLTADTDLHAGGIFFCIIYRKCLVFLDNGEVELSKELVDAFRPMDDVDVRLIQNYRYKGRYIFNDREYLECHFEEINLTLTGLPTKKNPAIIPFHAFSQRLQRSWSEVFILDNNVVIN
jgi:hypothetical protein